MSQSKVYIQLQFCVHLVIAILSAPTNLEVQTCTYLEVGYILVKEKRLNMLCCALLITCIICLPPEKILPSTLLAIS